MYELNQDATCVTHTQVKNSKGNYKWAECETASPQPTQSPYRFAIGQYIYDLLFTKIHWH